MKTIKLYGTTASDGSLQVTSQVHVLGELVAIEWIDGDLVDGVDFTLTNVRDNNAADVLLFTGTNANNDKVYYPRTPVHDTAGAELTFNGTQKVVDEMIVNGLLRLAITGGGDTKSGGCIVYVDC